MLRLEDSTFSKRFIVKRSLILLGFCLLLTAPASAQDTAPKRVTVETFARAESDRYFADFVKQGGFNKFHHERELANIDRQTVIRLNRDTLYSFGVFDLDAAPLTLRMPDSGQRYQAVQLINEDHYAQAVYYSPGTYSISRQQCGTRYVAVAVRTFVDPNKPGDLEAVHKLQDAIKFDNRAAGTFEPAAWDPASLTDMREALLQVVRANGELDSAKMFGRKTDVDAVQHLLGTAAGWGGNPRTAAMYMGAVPEKNDGKTAYTLTLKDVPVDGFWSVSVYNKAGFFEKNATNLYSVNNVTAKPNADGSVTVHFGGSETAPNYVPIMDGWNYLIRLYRPRPEILDGSWKAPAAEVAK